MRPCVSEFLKGGAGLLQCMLGNWHRMTVKSQAKYQTFMTVANQFTPTDLFYMKYFEPIFLSLSLILLLIVFFVFKHGKALKTVQILLLVSCMFENCSVLIVLPFDIIFTHFVNTDVPVPNPLISSYIYIYVFGVQLIFTISLFIKGFFSVNRVLSIQFPMKAKIWLRPKKIIRVCLITTIIGTLCFVGLNFHSVSVTLTAWQER